MQVTIHPDTQNALKNFKLPEDLTFGKVLSPIMIECNFDRGQWGPLELKPYQSLTLYPTCKVLHYSQTVFEGMKAYTNSKTGPFLFRPDINCQRFKKSAIRVAIPPLPDEIFHKSLELITSYSSKLIPKNLGDSLYIRPFIFSTDNGLGLAPAKTYKYLTLASPSSAFFKNSSIRVLIERDATRAAPGGVGNVKTGGNYAASLLSMTQAKNKSYDQVLWLDAIHKKYIEEMSGMNFFLVYGKELITPKITSTILDGVTRNSIIQLAKNEGHSVREESITIDEAIQDIKNQSCTESFACGTAVVICPISELGEQNTKNIYKLKFSFGDTTKKLRERLLSIQQGISPNDPFKWRHPIQANNLL